MRCAILGGLVLAAMLVPLAATAGSATGCEPVAPIRSLSFDSRYASNDPARATLDPEREAEVLAALAPLDGFIETLVEHTARLYEGRTRDRRAAAACIVGLLGDWAEADALSDLGTETVELTLGSRLASLALIAWQAAPYEGGTPEFGTVVAWLERRVSGQMAFWETAPDGARRGNLRAWAALSGAALALLSDRDDLAPWAAASLRDVVCTAGPDGSLPQEMSRGELALHYQLHAVAPLVTASALLERQGVAMQDTCDGALHRIVAFTIGEVTGENRTAKIAGVAQSLDDEIDQLAGFRLAWVEPYLHLRDNVEIDAAVDELRPLNYTKLGGNQTALWGE